MTRTARVALLQLPAFSIEGAAASLAHTLQRIDDAAAQKPDIIALPEATYPAYFIGGAMPPEAPSIAEAMEAFAGRARRHGVWIAAGMALDDGHGGLTNGAALFARDGSLAGRYDKSFLWHFDDRWFARGSAYPVFETDAGRIGILICADGRLPEIARSLALNGAQIILDLTAWVSGARRTEDLTTVQREYLMQTRAVENGVWIACADKFGVEADSIVYTGRSCVIDPRGEYVASLGPDEDAALVYDIPLAAAAPPVLRRPAMYEHLAHPTESLPVMRTLSESFVPQEHERRIAAVQMAMPDSASAFLAAARTHAERLRWHDADIVLFPATPSRLRAAYPHSAVREGVLAIARDTGMLLAFTVSEGEAGSGMRVMYLLGPRGIVAEHRQTHVPPGNRFASMPLGDDIAPVVNTPAGRVGMMIAAEGYVPEIARSLMLRGAEVLLWAADAPGGPMHRIVRARADENRVFVASASAPVLNGATMIADPAGRILAQALEGRELSVSASVNRGLSHLKAMAPGTDVVRNRQPETYGTIVGVASAGAVI